MFVKAFGFETVFSGLNLSFPYIEQFFHLLVLEATRVVDECYVIVLLDPIPGVRSDNLMPMSVGTATHCHFIIWDCKDPEVTKNPTGFGLKVRSGDSLLML